MRNIDVIAIHGLKQSGKSTIARVLREEYGFVTVKFAGTLKDMMRGYFRTVGYSAEQTELLIEGPDAIREAPLACLHGKSSRYAMQTVGTEYRLLLDRDMWGNVALGKTSRLVREQGKKVVIDDVRFQHETDGIRAPGLPASELWVVTTGRQPVPVQGLDFDCTLPPPSSFDMVFPSMFRPFLSDVGLNQDEVEDAIAGGPAANVGYAVIGNKTPAFAALALREEWWEGIMLGPAPQQTSAGTAKHASEQGLPLSIFDIHYQNDGTIADLEAQVHAHMSPEMALRR